MIAESVLYVRSNAFTQSNEQDLNMGCPTRSAAIKLKREDSTTSRDFPITHFGDVPFEVALSAVILLQSLPFASFDGCGSNDNR